MFRRVAIPRSSYKFYDADELAIASHTIELWVPRLDNALSLLKSERTFDLTSLMVSAWCLPRRLSRSTYWSNSIV